MERLKAYISGPIAGIRDANISEFNDAASLVKAAGVEALIPHDIVPDHLGACPQDTIRSGQGGHSWACHLRYDLAAMLECDAVVMLPGWERSHGARIEHTVAAAVGIPIHYLGDFGSLRTSHGSHLFEAAREAVGERV